MRTLRRLLAAVPRPAPAAVLPPLPARGDHIETWLTAERDRHEDRYGRAPAWYVVDALLNGYRYRADNDIPLNQVDIDCPF